MAYLTDSATVALRLSPPQRPPLEEAPRILLHTVIEQKDMIKKKKSIISTGNLYLKQVGLQGSVGRQETRGKKPTSSECWDAPDSRMQHDFHTVQSNASAFLRQTLQHIFEEDFIHFS